MQITLEGKTKEAVAIERLQQFEPPEGYYLAMSYGKDSTCLYFLAKDARVKFDAHYSVVGIDPPELILHGRKTFPDVKWDLPEMSMWRWIEKMGMPTRLNRWCCRKLKERGGEGRVVLTGVRSEESLRRRNRPIYEVRKNKVIVNPIVDWTLLDVWDYIDSHKLPYCSLYDTYADRLGCVMCPMDSNRLIAMKRYPKIAEA